MRVHDQFLISSSDGNSPNRAVSSCQNAITYEKPYNQCCFSSKELELNLVLVQQFNSSSSTLELN